MVKKPMMGMMGGGMMPGMPPVGGMEDMLAKVPPKKKPKKKGKPVKKAKKAKKSAKKVKK